MEDLFIDEGQIIIYQKKKVNAFYFILTGNIDVYENQANLNNN